MQQPIIDYHQDAESYWVAQLACGHNQHLRHNPPWTIRTWVTHAEGRQHHLGKLLNCVKCDQNAPRDERPASPQVIHMPMLSASALAHPLGELLKKKGWYVSCAESCTGGLIAAAITDIPGSSGWFEQSWVTYSNRSKQQQLAITDEALCAGAVTQATAEAMAVSAQRVSGAECAVASSGIAGPDGGTAEKPVGTVWLAWSGPWGVISERFNFPGDRQQVRQQAVDAALGRLIRLISDT
ncbi:MAG TPA: nicotinamide-nucleotide amidohydrolase family protein [Cellvibrionaceae bacterium]